MKQADPEAMRKALAMVSKYKEMGLLFVPIPVRDEEEMYQFGAIAIKQLENILNEIEASK